MKTQSKTFFLLIASLGLLISSAVSPASAQLVLHEATNLDADTSRSGCVQPASYSYNDTNGVVDCNPVRRAECDYVVVCYYRRTRSCFPPETMIRMGDGSQKQISEVRTGDQVWNPIEKKVVSVGKLLKGPEKLPLREISYTTQAFGTKKIHTTQKHPMVVAGPNGSHIVKRANEVTTEDKILDEEGNFHPVSVSKDLPVVEGQLVYNFETLPGVDGQDARMIGADGVVTGDVVVQARLNGDKLPWE